MILPAACFLFNKVNKDKINRKHFCKIENNCNLCVTGIKMSTLLLKCPKCVFDSMKYYATPIIINHNYASDAKKVGSSSAKRVDLPVETDVHKLVNYLCGSNILKEGGEDIKLKPEGEYPDWLWNLYIGPAKELKDLDPNSKEYWLRVRLLGRRKNNLMSKLRRKYVKPY